MARQDPHSWCDDQQARTKELQWKAKVDFAQKTLDGEATLVLEKPSSGPLDLDSRELKIQSVKDGSGKALKFTVEPPDPILGSRVRIELGSGTRRVKISYSTSPSASALQWLAPEQTAGGKEPYLFTQCQAIPARSVVPLQDTPRLRITFKAELTFPKRLRSVMAAGFQSRSEKGDLATEKWEMPQRIPPYLLAFAVGDLASKDVGPR